MSSNKEKYERVISEVKKKIRPSKEEEKNVQLLIEALKGVLYSIELDEKFEIKLVGSIAKGTWLSYDHDIDIFLLFPPEAVEKFPAIISYLAKIVPEKLAKKGIKAISERKHSNYPYVFLRYGGIHIDIVPAVNMDLIKSSEKRILTTVDRTPLHTEYVHKKILEHPELADEIRLLKKFLKTVGTYGSEIKIQGFSGYLCEILVISLGSFIDVLEWFSKKMFPAYFKPKDSAEPDEKDFEKWRKNPLIVPDPTDPHRNVASALNLENILYTKLAAKLFLFFPSKIFFEVTPRNKNLDYFVKKNTENTLGIIFEINGITEDIIWSQMWRNTKRIEKFLKNKNFPLVRVKPVELVEEKKYGFIVYSSEEKNIRLEGPKELPLNDDYLAPILSRIKRMNTLYGPLILDEKLVHYESIDEQTLYETIEEFLQNPSSFKWSRSVKKSITNPPRIQKIEVIDKKYGSVQEWHLKLEEILTGKKPWFRHWLENLKKS